MSVQVEMPERASHIKQADVQLMKNKAKAKIHEPDSIPFTQLFRFASTSDRIMMVIGLIGAAAGGAAMPVFSLLLGNVTTSFAPGHSGKEVFDAAVQICWEFIVVGAGTWVVFYLGYAFWNIVGDKQGIEIRKRYFRSLLSQEIAFYDSVNPNELATKIAEECFNIQQGVGEKVATFVNSMATMVAGFLIGYIKGWQLALVLTAFLPIIFIAGSMFVYAMQKLTRINNEAYSQSGAISEEALNAIRTIVSLGGQAKESKRYKDVLAGNSSKITRFSVFAGCAVGFIFLAMFSIYALGFYVGAVFIKNETYNPVSEGPYKVGDVLTIFFSILMASFVPSQAAPCVKAFAIAKASGAKAFKIIDKKSLISIEDPRGIKPASIIGDIHFNNVSFAYPLKADRQILKGISFHIRKNEKTAFVGESGCGKTTSMQLIERFYDLVEGSGSITLDGVELKNLNLKWMRDNIGYVGQEPVLFATSIKENLLMAKEDATDDQLWEALKRANAAEFVQSLPKKLDTFVGTNGAQLSGGQKQRLAIARAILKNPRILLLDEATSALDRKNEREIQKTLDEISQGRTTIVIAHRLSTIINSDHIIVFDQGKVVEEGRHEELVAKKGRYYALQHLQLQAEEREKTNQADEKDSNENPTIKVSASATIERNPSKKKSMVHDVELTVFDGNEDAESAKKTANKKDKKEEPSMFYIIKRLMQFNKSDSHLIVFGVLAALVHGCVNPFISILLSNMIQVLAVPSDPDFMHKSRMYAILFFVCAVVAFISMAIQMSCFNTVAERLSRKVRGEVFDKYVKMPIGWFDEPQNSPGALGSKLSTDATLLNTLTGSVFGSYVQAVSCFATGLIIAFIASWKLTLIGLGLSPLLIISGIIRTKFSMTFMSQNDEVYQESASFVSEAVNNMRTVASFANEAKIMSNYSKKLAIPLKNAVSNGHKSGLAFGFGQFVMFLIYGIIFLIGGEFIRKDILVFKDLFQSLMGIMFGALGTSNALAFAPDVGSAKAAAISVFKVFDSKPAIDIDEPSQNVRTPIKGDIEFRNVTFKYPSREKPIFKNFNLKINPSTKVALVGPSGCGKSTVLALLQRFYDPDQGEVLIDGVNIKRYDLRHLRESFGVVSQEPVLFNGTIEYNIKYSKEDATDEEMRQAAIKASAIGFIENNEFDAIGDAAQASKKFGTGFQRKVGPKGSQMSGGQKQRIAIARAIMKNPSVLILDEATSALDAQNEKIVQESLDQIMSGKTSVIVAHRISTIRDADEILVFNDGEIAERGAYQMLMEKRGIFYKLEKGTSTA